MAKSKVDNKAKYGRETTLFMGFGLLLGIVVLIEDIIDAIFGETITIMSIVSSLVFIAFYGYAYYCAEKGKMIAGILELVVGVLMTLRDFLSDSAIGLTGILGILITIHSIIYLFNFNKNK